MTQIRKHLLTKEVQDKFMKISENLTLINNMALVKQIYLDATGMEFNIQLNDEVPGILRAKLDSRFKSAKTHQLWIEYNSTLQNHHAITGYYCDCWAGARTVGMCAHVTCVIWFVGYKRHQAENIHVRKPRVLEFLDAADVNRRSRQSAPGPSTSLAERMVQESQDSSDTQNSPPNIMMLRSHQPQQF
ncbi:Calcium-binding mitochondrial carrier protein Aralar1 [Folsomia candida]|uniref:Calcium-binding mitochondrial carrier protein Aralar1 n=1 Tax=Folsomia candida TaxID=158441 RepID=A0A226D315_FOLCA|nr:Calcium-binding mitochondrial carrier protein Aralar1 [Folsomia candida]